MIVHAVTQFVKHVIGRVLCKTFQLPVKSKLNFKIEPTGVVVIKKQLFLFLLRLEAMESTFM